MRANEPIDMAKWAIALLIFSLVLGATIFLFYMLYDKTDERIDSMQKAATSSNMDRLYDLQDQTLRESGDYTHYPLCSNVVSALTEFSEEDLLYIAVKAPTSDEVMVFSYEDITITTQNGDTVKQSQTPVTEACRYLLQYSDCRTEVTLGKYDAALGTESVDLNSPGLLFVRLILYPDPVLNNQQ